MEKIPQGRYTPEFRAEAVKLITEGGVSSPEAARRLSIPKSTLENWVRASKTGKLGEIGKSLRPLTDVEMELTQVKRELVIVKMERDLLKKRQRTLPKSRCKVRDDEKTAT